jgi:hypothetical protein
MLPATPVRAMSYVLQRMVRIFLYLLRARVVGKDIRITGEMTLKPRGARSLLVPLSRPSTGISRDLPGGLQNLSRVSGGRMARENEQLIW